VTIKKKFVRALVAYAVLGVLAWTTLSNEPIRVFNGNVRLRTGTLLIWVCSPFDPRCISGDFGSRKSGKAQSRRIEGLEVWAVRKKSRFFAWLRMTSGFGYRWIFSRAM